MIRNAGDSIVYLLGAGASRGYDASPTGVRPPLATGLIAAYPALAVSGDIDVKVGTLVNYVRDYYGIPPAEFASFDMDAEQFMTDLRVRIERGRERFATDPSVELDVELMTLGGAYSQAVFLFTHVLNEICNGPVALDYARLLEGVTAEDALITFNWDVLLDRTLEEKTAWLPDSGYGIAFDNVMDNGWREVSSDRSPSAPQLLKLHGSTNWFSRMANFGRGGERLTLVADSSTRAMTLATDAYYDELEIKGLVPLVEAAEVKYKVTLDATAGNYKAVPAAAHLLEPCLFISGERPYDAWRGRWRPGYARYTYFYPPNLPNGIPTMPLIVAPTRDKEYTLFASFLEPIWSSAAERLAGASHLCVIGYSFPKTDLRARDLVRNFEGQVTIVNPNPEPVREALLGCSVPNDNIIVFAGTLGEFNNRPEALSAPTA
jgi:hypothetical protein